MANDTYKHTVFGKRYLKKLLAAEAAWLANKDNGEPRNAELAVKVRNMRTRYREKYRPLPEYGVSLGRSVF